MDKEVELAADEVMFRLWDVTTGCSYNWRTCFRGATRFAKYVLWQIEEKRRLERDGETHIETRGLVIPTSILKAWTWNVLEDCYERRCPPPFELLQAVYHFMGCTHHTRQRRRLSEREWARAQQGSLREAARELDVAPTTIRSWRDQSKRRCDPELFQELRRRTGYWDFMPKSWSKPDGI